MQYIVIRVVPDDLPAFKEGGLVAHANMLKGAGRYGDTHLVHVNDDELEELRQMWGPPTINPETGLPEYFLKGLWKAIKKVAPIASLALPFVGPAIGLSTLATTGIGAGLGAINGGVKGAITGGLGAGIGAGLGADVGSALGIGKLGGNVALGALSGGIGQGNLEGALAGGLTGGIAGGLGEDLGGWARDGLNLNISDRLASSIGDAVLGGAASGVIGGADAILPGAVGTGLGSYFIRGMDRFGGGENASESQGVIDNDPEYLTRDFSGAYSAGPVDPDLITVMANTSPSAINPIVTQALGGALTQAMIAAQRANGSDDGSVEEPGQPVNLDGLSGPIDLGVTPSPLEQVAYDPSTATLDPEEIRVVAGKIPPPAITTDGLGGALSSLLAQPVNLQAAGVTPQDEEIAVVGTRPPSTVITDPGYAIAAPLLTLTASDFNQYQAPGTKPKDPNPTIAGLVSPASSSGVKPGSNAGVGNTPGTVFGDRLQVLPFDRNRNDYLQEWYTYGQRPEHQFFQQNVLPKPAGFARGGDVGSARTGALSTMSRLAEGPGSGREDAFLARLSDGEYVIDAETVALLGDGSTKAGAGALDRLRAEVRRHKGKALSKGKISPNAKSPLEYLAGAR